MRLTAFLSHFSHQHDKMTLNETTLFEDLLYVRKGGVLSILVQAYLRDVVGWVPDHHIKASVAIK